MNRLSPGYARHRLRRKCDSGGAGGAARLAQRYGGTDPADADVIVALGGDGISCCKPCTPS